MKRFHRINWNTIVVAGLLVLGTVSCNKTEVIPEVIKFRGILNRLNMVPKPSVTTVDDNGRVSGSYNPVTKMFDYTVHWVGITHTPVVITAVIFYQGAPGVNGPEIFRLNNFVTSTSEFIKGSYLVPDHLRDKLLAGNFYVVVKHEVLRISVRAQFTRL